MDYVQGMKLNVISTKSKRTMLFLLALPLALAAGCASNPANSYFPATPAPTIVHGSERRSANIAVGDEMFWMFMADTNINYSMSLSINEGIVSLGDNSLDGPEQQAIVNQMWELPGVNQVNDASGIVAPPTLAPKTVAVR
jgi:hypothetical protein